MTARSDKMRTELATMTTEARNAHANANKLRTELAALKREHARLREAAERVTADDYVWSKATRGYLRAALAQNDTAATEPATTRETFDPAACGLCAGTGSPGPYRDEAVCPTCAGTGLT